MTAANAEPARSTPFPAIRGRLQNGQRRALIRARQIFGSEPSARKACTAKPRNEIGALTQEIPDEAGAVILEHQDNRPLVDPEVERRYP